MSRKEEPDSLEFVPSSVDEDAARAEIERHAESLRYSVDEAVGHPLDNLINAWADKWVADVEAEHALYLARAEAPLGTANTRLNELDVVREQDTRRLAETDEARSAAVSALDEEKPLLGGRPKSIYLHVIALLCAAAADVAAFIQVVNLLGRQRQTVTVLLVIGFTSLVLYLAHVAGTLVKEKKGKAAAAYLIVWATMGLLAAWVRLISPPPASAQVSLSLDSEATGATPENQQFAFAGAGLFLALYLGSGLAACIGSYLTHHSARSAFMAAVAAYRRAVRRVRAIERDHGAARTAWQVQISARDAAAKVLAAQKARRLAFAEELKQYTRVLLAEKARDPSVTDAILAEDKRPYDYSTNGSSGRHA
ncbi:hypothetical protein [Lentzea aerocolonigenes]|uniref:hypothetical protein n=1 Tax=Lentzea aerocolonigenes TaxID=68170 RepID=UPI0004C43338|nr:hypothetical protein [Lentzea aerocolonigenes]MCP2250620.1 hypothetical protein [Lentzea aerocolonigenes]